MERITGITLAAISAVAIKNKRDYLSRDPMNSDEVLVTLNGFIYKKDTDGLFTILIFQPRNTKVNPILD